MSSIFADGAGIFGYSQYYAQIRHTFYFITTGSIVYEYNLISDKFNNVTQIPMIIDTYGCLAATNDKET